LSESQTILNQPSSSTFMSKL